MTSATAAHPAAGRFDHTHGDEDGYWPTAHEEALIEQLADEKLAERLYRSPEYFADLMDGVNGSAYYAQIQREMANLDRACKGDKIALDAITTALHQIDRVLKAAAEKAWRDECTEEAQAEVLGVEL